MKNIITDIYQKRFIDIKKRNKIWKILDNFFFQKYINIDDTVLDLACGYGEFINNIQCKEKIAVDINPDSKKYLNNKVKFICNSSTDLKDINSNSINKIFISNFFEHITREDILLTIKEIKRILRKSGQVLILQPNIRLLGEDFWMFFDHITPVDDRAIEEVFNLNYFTLVKKILRFLPYTTKSRLPKNDFFIKLYLKLPFLWQFFGKQSFLIFKKNS